MTVHLSFTSDARQTAEDTSRLRVQFDKLTHSTRQYRAQVAGLQTAQAELNRRIQQAPVAFRAARLAHQNLALQAKQLTAQQAALSASTRLTTKAMSAGVTAAQSLAAAYNRVAVAAAAAAARSNAKGSAALGALGGLGGFGGLAGAGGAFTAGRFAMEGERANVRVERMLARDATGMADAMEQFNRVASNTPHALEAVSAAIFNTKTLLEFYGDDLGDVVEAQAQFASVTGQNFTAMNQLISQTFKAFETDDAEDAIRQLDTILGLVQEYRLNVPALLASLGRTGSTFRALGFDLADTANFMAQITQFGVNVEQINEPIRQMVVNMSKLGLDPREGLIQAVEAIKNAQTDAEAFRLGSEIFGTEGGHVFVDMIRVQAIPALLDLEAQILDGNIPSIEKLYEETKTTGEEFDTLKNKIKLTATEQLTPVMKDSMSFFERIASMFDDIAAALPGGVSPLNPDKVPDESERKEMIDKQVEGISESRKAAAEAAAAAKAGAAAAKESRLAAAAAAAAAQGISFLAHFRMFGIQGAQEYGVGGGSTADMSAFTAEMDAARAARDQVAARSSGRLEDIQSFGIQQQSHGGFTAGTAQRFMEQSRAARAAGIQTERDDYITNLESIIASGTTTGPQQQLANLRKQRRELEQALENDPMDQWFLHSQALKSTDEQIVELLERMNETLENQEMNIYLDGNPLNRIAVGPIAGRARGTC